LLRTRLPTAPGGLLVVAGGALLLTGPRPGNVAAAARDPVDWARQVGPDTAALTIAGTLCWLVLLWLAVSLGLMAATAAPGAVGRLADAVAAWLLPSSVRRLAAGLLGLSLSASAAGCSGPTSPAATLGPGPPAVAGLDGSAPAESTGEVVDWPLSSARPAPSGHPARPERGVDWPLGGPAAAPGGDPERRASAGATAPSGGSAAPPGAPAGGPASRPRRPAGSPGTPAGGAASGAASGAARESKGQVVVGVGDCLWLIAARRLGAGASAAQIAAETRHWYSANRAVIGPDPDLLQVGQVLTPPRRPPS
jgi:nucleoid-associated protein YgaU